MKNICDFSIIVDANNEKKRKISKSKVNDIPTINNIDALKKNNYTVPNLKSICKHYQLKVSGKKPELDYDGWMYMLHGDMGEDNTKQLVFKKEDAVKGHWIESGAHLMLMPKDPTSLKGQTTDFNSGSPYIMFEGTGYDHIMIPVEGYYDYQPQK